VLFCLVHGTVSRRLKRSGIHYISRFVGALAPVTCSGVSQMTWHRYYSPRCQCLFHRVDNNQKCCWCHSVNRPEKCWLTVQIRTVTVWWRWSMSYGAEQKNGVVERGKNRRSWSGRRRKRWNESGARSGDYRNRLERGMAIAAPMLCYGLLSSFVFHPFFSDLYKLSLHCSVALVRIDQPLIDVNPFYRIKDWLRYSC